MDQPSVILLTIDALRADHLGYHGYERDTSPFLDSLAERSICFTNAVSASSHTREAMPALLSGRYPDEFAVNGYRKTGDTITDRLSKNGYATAGFHSNPYLSRAYGYDSGFDSFDDDLMLGQNRVLALIQRALDKFVFHKGEYHARATEINDRSLAWLDSKGESPFFLWNHYMDTHGPYNPPENTHAHRDLSNDEAHDLYQKIINQPGEVTDEERDLLVDSYDSEIRYLDHQLERFFQALQERGFMESSLIIVTADHGDAFGEHGYFTHPRYLHEQLIHVPLLVLNPGTSTGAVVDTPVSTLDIVPTILEWIGRQVNDLPGKPLVDQDGVLERPNDSTVYVCATGEGANDHLRRFAARKLQWKVVIERDISSGEIIKEQAYNLREDPEEKNAQSPEEIEVEELLEDIHEFSSSRLAAVEQSSPTNTLEKQSSEVAERLEALGYK